MNPNPVSESQPVEAPTTVRDLGSSRVRLLYFFILGTAAVLSLVWAALAHVTLARAIDARAEATVSLAAGVLAETTRLERQTLEAECQLLSDEPRLKSTLATRGIDDATITDILQDLQPATGAKILATLTPNARVQAVIGESALAGLDLSSWSVIKAAAAAAHAVSGGWTLGGRALNVGATAIRLGDRPIAFLLLATELDEKSLARIERLTGTSGGIVVGAKAPMSVSHDPKIRSALERAAASIQPGQVGRVDDLAARVDEIGSAVPSVKSVWLQPTGSADADFKLLDWLLWSAAIATLLFTGLLAWQSRELQARAPRA